MELPSSAQCFTPEEVAETLRISRATVYRSLKEQRIRNFKIGGLIRIPRESLLDLLSLAVPDGKRESR